MSAPRGIGDALGGRRARRGGARVQPAAPEVRPRPPQRLQEREEAAHGPEQGGEGDLSGGGGGRGRGVGGWNCCERPRAPAQDFVEVCKREGGDLEEKGVDRLLGLGSSRCVARGGQGVLGLRRQHLEEAEAGPVV